MDRELKVGMGVVFIDEYRILREALVTAIHGEPGGYEGGRWPCVNLVVVDRHESAQDQYGRQLVRESSVVHWRDSTAQGNCWCWGDEDLEARAAI